jgi:hypothetical protein
MATDMATNSAAQRDRAISSPPALNRDSDTYVYPAFDTLVDLWFMRISGSGLGNCFYTYFHAVVLAEQYGARLIAPPWFSVKFGPMLRREKSKRFYFRMFKPYSTDVSGIRKLWILLSKFRRQRTEIDEAHPRHLVPGRLNIVSSGKWTFAGLHPHRELIRQRMLAILNDPVPPGHRWGAGHHVGIHVRLGDFTKVDTHQGVLSAGHSTRLPITWYVTVARALQQRFPELPLLIFSDGRPEELQPLLDLGGRIFNSGSDITDFLALAGSSILVGSNSTFSRWAAFLGNMPSIWLQGIRIDKEVFGDRTTDPEVPLLRVPIDATEVALWS